VGCGYSPSEWRRGERGVGEDLSKIWCMHGLGSLLSLSFLKNSNNGMARAFLVWYESAHAWKEG
jgi:hypothetical protein